MGNRRSGCIGIGVLLIVAGVVVVAALVMVGPRFSDTLRRLADRIATPTGVVALSGAPTSAAAPTRAGVPAEAMAPEEEAVLTLEVTPAATATRAQPSPARTLAGAVATRTPVPTSTPPPDAVVTVETLNLRAGRARSIRGWGPSAGTIHWTSSHARMPATGSR